MLGSLFSSSSPGSGLTSTSTSTSRRLSLSCWSTKGGYQDMSYRRVQENIARLGSIIAECCVVIRTRGEKVPGTVCVPRSLEVYGRGKLFALTTQNKISLILDSNYRIVRSLCSDSNCLIEICYKRFHETEKMSPSLGRQW